MSPIKDYHHISLSVSDLGKSTGWYCDVLGLEVDAEIEGAGFSRTRLTAETGVTVTLTCHDEQLPGPFDEHRPGMDHVAFEIDGKDMEAFKERFEQLGVDHSEIKKAQSGSALITLRDPDNIQLEVFGNTFDPSLAAGRS